MINRKINTFFNSTNDLTFGGHLAPESSGHVNRNIQLGPKSSNDATNQEISDTRLWVPDEIEKNIDSMDWVLLSIDENSFHWNFELLKTYEKYVDFGSLSVNRQAWIECFGKLTDDDIESFLTDKEVQAQLVSYSILDDMSEVEKSHFNLPESMTFEYFLKSYTKK